MRRYVWLSVLSWFVVRGIVMVGKCEVRLKGCGYILFLSFCLCCMCILCVFDGGCVFVGLAVKGRLLD